MVRQANSVAEPRPADVVMDPQRLGSAHAYRLSFMRVLLRRVMQQKWSIRRQRFDLDDDGYGVAIYSIKARHQHFSFVAFAQPLEASRRSDRVIADRWDMTVTLCAGDVDDEHLEMLRRNVPLQEGGRLDARSIVLSRANRSVRNFNYVVGELAAGRQPAAERLLKVGYLYRTTAVYGSGKFGMADWQKVRQEHPDFNRPFGAEMFSCYMIRQFSIDQAQHIATHRAPDTAVILDNSLQRYIGIGNATGLGMAPYLINHPQLIDRWIQVRELAVATILTHCPVNAQSQSQMQSMLLKASRHFSEIAIDDEQQSSTNAVVAKELAEIAGLLETSVMPSWSAFLDSVEAECCLETQEAVRSLLTELHPEEIDNLEDQLVVDEAYRSKPDMPLAQFIELLGKHYGWSLQMDLAAPQQCAVFWYRSREKMEPRLGECELDPGEDRSLPMMVARDVQTCYAQAKALLEQRPKALVAELLLAAPELRSIVRRVQTMCEAHYGDIRVNLGAHDVQPMHLLRCKLSFFGVSKFDPRSRLWVRNTMFQGAPVISDIGSHYKDDWYFPCIDVATEISH